MMGAYIAGALGVLVLLALAAWITLRPETDEDEEDTA